MTHPRVVFLDIDGVLNNRACYRPNNRTPDIGCNPDPASVVALNHITMATGAVIVVSSTWRGLGMTRMREILRAWGVLAPVIDVTPRLPTKMVGSVHASTPRGEEIQAWLENAGDHYKVESFVILDDDADMAHLMDRLVKTTFDEGLTMEHAERAIAMLEGE